MNRSTPSNSDQTAGRVKILLPFKRSERCFRVIRLFEMFSPQIAIELHILHVMDDESHEPESDVMFDLHQISTEFLKTFNVTIHIEKGEPYSAIVQQCLQLHINLLIIPHPPIQRRFFLHSPSSVWFFLRHSPVPTLYIPDPSSQSMEHLEFKKVLVNIDSNSNPTLDHSISFALKTARLTASETIISMVSGLLRRNRSERQLNQLITTFFSNESRKNVQSMVRSGSFSSVIQNIIQTQNTDLLIMTCPGSSRLGSSGRLRMISDLIPSLCIPFMICRKLSRLSALEARFNQIYDSLTNIELTKDTTPKPSSSPPEEFFQSESMNSRFLGLYTRQGLQNALVRYGVMHLLAKIGYPDVSIDIDASDPYRQRLRIFARTSQDSAPDIPPLVDLIVRQQKYPDFQGSLPNFPSFASPYLVVEWICLQDPLRHYRKNQIPLPGQVFPGLGLGWQVLLILKLMARRLRAPGLYNCPEFYHNARFFHRFFRFASPESEATILAIDRDTFPIHSVETSWIIAHRLLIRDGEQRPFIWTGTPQILPLHPALINYFRSDIFLEAMMSSLNSIRFKIKVDEYKSFRKSGRLFSPPEAHQSGDRS